MPPPSDHSLTPSTRSTAGPVGPGGGSHPAREDAPVLAMTRRIVKSLKRVTADAAEQRRLIESRYAESTAVASQAHDAAVKQATGLLESQRAAAEAAWSEAVRLATSRHGAETSAAQAARTRDRNVARERGQRDVDASKKQRDEAVWFAETCLDTDVTKNKAQRQADVQQIANMNGRIEAVRREADAVLVAWRQGITITPAATPTDSPDPFRVYELGIGRAEAAFDSMTRYRAPFFIKGLVPWLIVLAFAFAAATGVAWWHGWIVDINTGAGFIGGLLLGSLAVWVVFAGVKRRSRLLVEPLVDGLAQAIGATRAQADLFDLADRQRNDESKARFERDAGKAREKHEANLLKVQERLGEIAKRVEEATAAALARAEAEKAVALASAESVRVEAVGAANQRHASAVAAAGERFESVTAGARADYERAWRELRDRWTEQTGSVRADVEAMNAVLKPGRVRWEELAASGSPDGYTFSPTPTIEAATVTLDLAPLVAPLEGDPRLPLDLPGLLPLGLPLEVPRAASLALLTSAEHRTRATEALSVAMLRLLTTLPPGKARFTIIDPVGLGQSFAGFMRLAEFATTGGSLVGERIWTEPRHVEQKLADITEHMETVIQKYLRNQYATIDEYNTAAGEVAEPYRFVVLADFPTNITEVAAKRLESILASGPRCGVYVLLAATRKDNLPQGIKWADVTRACQLLVYKDGHWVWNDADFSTLPVSVPSVPSPEAFSVIADTIGAAAMEASRVRVPFASVSPTPGDEWTRSTSEGLRVPIGRAGATKLQHLALGQGTQQHVLIAGRTGSGKSTLLNVIITAAALWHSPDEVELYLVDFKKGVEFKAYATARLPHARVIAVESEREFGLSVLRRLDAELTRRGDLFRTAGVQSLTAYRGSPGAERMPRVLLIVDEFQEFFIEDDKLAQEAGLLMDRLVRQGRAFGMHVVLGSQTLAGAYSLARSTMGQMGVRIALQCSEADSYLILADDNPAARLLNRPGEAIYNDASGMLEGNNPFQVTWLEDQERAERLAELPARAAAWGRPIPPTILFEGNAPAKAVDDPEMEAMLKSARTQRVSSLKFSLGAPISIKEPSGAPLRRRSASNLLIVGQNEDQALGMLSVGLAGLLLHDAAAPSDQQTRVVLVDGTPADTALAGTLARVAAVSGGRISEIEYRGVGAAIGELHATLTARLSDESGATGAPPVVLCIAGLQRFRTLQRSEDDFGFGGEGEAPKPDKQLAQIVREGPAVGIHTVVWADSAANLDRFFKRQALSEFDARVLLQMSVNDSSNLIDSPAAGNLGRDRALLFSEERGTVERFRPYAVPPAEWLSKVNAAVNPVA